MTTGLDVFDRTLQHTNLWLKDLMELLGTGDRKLAYNVLKATLHALRDRIGPENAIHLGAQLPILIRGIYYDGWHFAQIPSKERHKEEFLDYVDGDVFRGLGVGVEIGVRSVFEVMCQRMDPGEVEKIIRVLPKELQALWPDRRRPTPSAEPAGWP